jgi:hypothetical protein
MPARRRYGIDGALPASEELQLLSGKTETVRIPIIII